MQKMFRLMIVSALVLTGLVAAAAAQTPSVSKKVRFDFPFNVGDKEMPAGQYRIRIVNNADANKLIVVEQMDGRATAFAPTIPSTNKAKLAPGAVLFNRYGEQHFLAGIQLGDERYILQALKSRSERDAIKQADRLAQTKSQKAIPPSTE